MVNRRLWFRGGPKPVRPLFGQVRSASPRAASLGLDEDVEPRAHVSGSSDERSPTVIRRLLFVNQYYWPDQASTAQHLADLAESLAARGFECHVLCAQGRHQPGEPAPPAHEVHEGVHIHRVPATSLGRRTTLTRMADYLSFYARAVLMAAWLPRFDAAVTLTTPPLIG
jgi:colanic acid biosynthesis glycosyl transferase WcaI